MMTTSTRVEDAKLHEMQQLAGLPFPPTEATYAFRQAVSGEGDRAFDWQDKPHRLVYDLCRIIEADAWNRRSASPSIGRVGVKELEWEPTGSYPFVAISLYYYIGHQSGDGRYWVHHRIFGDLREGDGTIEHHLTLDAAKAAAQEDHERKILWQIVGSSDPDVAPPNVEHLRPLADREKSATLVYHEEPAGDTQGARRVTDETQPAIWVSAAQLAEHVDPDPRDGSEGGNYLPARKTAAEVDDALAVSEAKVAELQEALKPFAKAADVKLCGEWRDDERFGHTDITFHLTFGDLRAARRALEQSK